MMIPNIEKRKLKMLVEVCVVGEYGSHTFADFDTSFASDDVSCDTF
ncbi:MAG: hypothetical protein O2964_16375 [Verrucomicrobia bacterium]|nr:hypothetical protein [Verrucomicrobiota bacterium]